MNYVDMGPNDGQKTDPACLERTYDGHKGTDFAILDEKIMKNGVDVLAAMAGTVKRIRDGEPDRWPSDGDLEQVKKARKECGNAVLIDHGNDLETIYCHLKQGSITVKPDQKVKKGETIAQVGLSGFTQFPHVHFGIIQKGQIIDPFTNQSNSEKCGADKKSLWDQNLVLDYQPLIIQETGFRNILPDLDDIERQSKTPDALPMTSELMAFWVTLFGAREGDIITMEIKDPNGKIFTQRRIEQEKTRARQFYYTGKKLRHNPPQEGAYTGTVMVTRTDKNGEKQSWQKNREILITP